MNCLMCKTGDMQPARDNYFTKVANGYIIVENVPCFKCNQCGEVVFSASVMERLDEIIAQLEKIASKIFVVEYSEAA